MAEDLDRLFERLEGDEPSPSFVVNLRAELLAEAAESRAAKHGAAEFGASRAPHDADDVVVEFVNAEPRVRGPGRTWWRPIGTVAAALLLFFVVASTRTSRNDVEATDATSASVLDDAVDTADGDDSVAAVDGDPDDNGAVFDAAATPLTGNFSVLDPGGYRVESLGTPFSFVVTDPVAVRNNSPGLVVFSHPASSGIDDRTLAIVRLSTLSDPTDPSTSLGGADDGWPADDVEGWLDALPARIGVENSSTSVLGGLDATRFDLALEESSCADAPADGCVLLGVNQSSVTAWLSAGVEYRIWIVDQEDAAPIAVVAAIGDSGELEWFDVAERLLGTMSFGEMSPNPIARAEAGAANLSFFGGIVVDLAGPASIIEQFGDDGVLRPFDDPFPVEFIANPVSREGELLTSFDDVMEVVEEQPLVVSEADSITVDGVEARIFDISFESDRSLPAYVRSLVALRRDENDELGWFVPIGRLWLMEHPTRGLLMVTVIGEGVPEDDFAARLERVDRLLESLVFSSR